MEKSMISLENEDTPVTMDELTDKLMGDGRKRANELYKAYKNEINYKVTQPFHNNEDKINLIKEEIKELNLTYQRHKEIQSPINIKAELINGLERSFSMRSERILYKHQYENHLLIVANSYLTLKKEKFLKVKSDELKGKPEKGEKIEWLGTASEFGLLINELENAGYLKIADHKRNKNRTSWLRTATLLFNAFHVPDLSRNGETSVQNINNEISKPSISNKEAGFFKITRTNRK
ncbi:MAG: hypothetical protein IPN08_06505 [Bacteroidales bacterium]|nr:hypothetical protein [Bacteroidales bacterium]